MHIQHFIWQPSTRYFARGCATEKVVQPFYAHILLFLRHGAGAAELWWGGVGRLRGWWRVIKFHNPTKPIKTRSVCALSVRSFIKYCLLILPCAKFHPLLGAYHNICVPSLSIMKCVSCVLALARVLSCVVHVDDNRVTAISLAKCTKLSGAF